MRRGGHEAEERWQGREAAAAERGKMRGRGANWGPCLGRVLPMGLLMAIAPPFLALAAVGKCPLPSDIFHFCPDLLPSLCFALVAVAAASSRSSQQVVID